MPKAKMKFPPIPGETPRAKFENLVRLLFSAKKTPEDEKLREELRNFDLKKFDRVPEKAIKPHKKAV
jgi:hypothetical protein